MEGIKDIMESVLFLEDPFFYPSVIYYDYKRGVGY